MKVGDLIKVKENWPDDNYQGVWCGPYLVVWKYPDSYALWVCLKNDGTEIIVNTMRADIEIAQV